MKRLFAYATLALLAACGSRSGVFDQPYTYLGPIASGKTVFYVNTPLRTIQWLDEGMTEMARAPIEYDADMLVPLAEKGLVGVVAFDEEMFRVFDAETGTTVRELFLGAPYDRFQETPEGRYFIASSSLSAEALLSSGIPGYLPGRVLVIDLSSFTGTIINVGKDISEGTFAFPPGAARSTLAAVLLQTGIVVFDYADPAIPAAFISLGSPGTDLRPTQAVWNHDGTIIFATAEGVTDVFARTITKRSSGLGISPNQISYKFPVASIATVPEPGFLQRVIAVSIDGQEIAVLSNSSEKDEFRISIPGISGSAGVVLTEDGHAWTAVTVSGGELKLVNPDTGDKRTTDLGDAIGWTRQVPGAGGRYLLVQSRSHEGEKVTAVSLATTIEDQEVKTRIKTFPVNFNDAVVDLLFDGATTYVVFQNARAVGRIDPASDLFTWRDLPLPAIQAVPLGNGRLFVDHETPVDAGHPGFGAGLATVVDMTPGSVAKTWSVTGFLLDGLLE